VFSRGRVTLAPEDPVTAAKVEFRMLSDDRDRERPRDGYQRAVALVRHPAVAGLADAVLAGQTPLAELEAPGALDRWMDDNVTNYVHAVSSCRMGAADDPATGRPRILTAAGGRRGHRRVAGARCRPARHRDSPSPVATLSD
jgi:choline dehydrogenase-like flavoprotein